MVMILFLFIFAVICTNYLKGQLYTCENWKGVKDKWDCLNQGSNWKNSDLNFDNIPEAMTTLFVISNSV
jgi:hypothetical protein